MNAHLDDDTAAPPRILIVDDDDSLLTLLAMRLEASGFVAHVARNAGEALGQLTAVRPQVAIVDLRLGPEELGEAADGLALFRKMRAVEPMLPVIILTAHGSIPDAVAATREGAAAFLTKPFDGRALVEEVRKLLDLGAPAADQAAPGWRRAIVTRNRAMLALLEEISRVGPLDATVLVTGPSGSGKELVARAIHGASRRAEAQFVAINCAALPEALLESELFGHVKGAFSGATADHPGLLRSAHGGTIFLDEIGDMPLPLQAKLLRVLQERKVRPVGGMRELDADARVVAATHRDLGELLREGTFREDLFYRLNVVRLVLPALEDRREDIPLLAMHFARTLGARYGRSITGFAPDAMEALVGGRWPGNVRQLMNVVEQCMVLADGPLITRTLVERALAVGAATPETQALPSLIEARDQFERDYLAQLLKLTGGNVAHAARIARRNRTEFYRLMQRHGLRSELFRRS
ncbi:MAG TPA: sigma 54-interacting transcriptional regulator [Burkholderiaceae bacterium]|nr:sigma 54-interacting transcriptional regulator [Burkholderiaceae bacterium]